MTIEQLESKLTNEELNSIYLLHGEETFLLESILKKIKKNFGEILLGINYIKIDEDNIKEILPNIESPSFGYEKKLIIINNTGLLKKEGKKKNIYLNEYKEKISKYIDSNYDVINESVILVFIEKEIEKKSLYKSIEKNNGIICIFDTQNIMQIGKRIKSICNGYKVNIDDNTIRYFIETCGTNMQELINEIRKLIECVGINGKITKELIDNLSTKQIQAVIFDLTDNLGKRNITLALETLNNLIYTKEPIQKILITLYNHFKKLYIVKLAQKHGKNILDSLKLKPNQTFLVNKYSAQSKLFKEEDLRSIVEELAKLDSDYKVGLIDLNIGLETILCNYCS